MLFFWSEYAHRWSKKDGNLGHDIVNSISASIIFEEIGSECLGNELQCCSTHLKRFHVLAHTRIV